VPVTTRTSSRGSAWRSWATPNSSSTSRRRVYGGKRWVVSRMRSRVSMC
jgi:hypothetical protein